MGNLCGESGPAAEMPDPLEAAKQQLMSLLIEMTGEAAKFQSLDTVKAVTSGVLNPRLTWGGGGAIFCPLSFFRDMSQSY